MGSCGAQGDGSDVCVTLERRSHKLCRSGALGRLGSGRRTRGPAKLGQQVGLWKQCLSAIKSFRSARRPAVMETSHTPVPGVADVVDLTRSKTSAPIHAATTPEFTPSCADAAKHYNNLAPTEIDGKINFQKLMRIKPRNVPKAMQLRFTPAKDMDIAGVELAVAAYIFSKEHDTRLGYTKPYQCAGTFACYSFSNIWTAHLAIV
ncbi:hypothetical protein PIB30_010260 [Stylosanthes scabra]|uniref:Uncharacterized protein n=1 Tax=Stylosanthes scabra TaxID=79078 RepID=A0ABU6T7J9_9FABA|nr:hypothetical protein [Stylosanthes scabra]